MPQIVLRLGTRRSPLALAQSSQVARALEARHPELRIELVPIVTRGDRSRGDLSQLGGKGLFTAELERGLQEGVLDLAVHSLKDLPVKLADGLTVAAYCRRADPRDVLISRAASGLDDLPSGAVVLTGSLRRRAQLLAHRNDLRIEPIRGNVDTRLRKWRASGHHGLILAAAGLERLGLDEPGARPLDPEVMLPAPGQGILAVETLRSGRAESTCRAVDDPASARAADAERRIVAAFGGDCTLPLAAWAREEASELRLTALIATPDGGRVSRAEAAGRDPQAVAEDCLASMYRRGAESVLAALRS